MDDEEEYREMTDDELELAWCHAHAGGATAGPIQSFSQGVDFIEWQIATGVTFDPMEMLASLAKGFSPSREEVGEANRRIAGTTSRGACGCCMNEDDMKATAEAEVYLGDGLYAEFNGFGIRLRVPREDGADHVVYLDPKVFDALQEFAAQCWPAPEET